MSRKWGSCSTAGRVSFSLDLLAEPHKIRKEIIIHELLHLKVPNHGKLFKALLKAYLAKDVSSARVLPCPEWICLMGKTVSSTKKTEWKGLDRISAVVHEMGNIWREMTKDDFGLDGEIEVVTAESRRTRL